MPRKKYNLVGIDGNAFAIMAYVTRAMKNEKFTQEEVDAYLADAQSSDYRHLVGVSVQMIGKCNER